MPSERRVGTALSPYGYSRSHKNKTTCPLFSKADVQIMEIRRYRGSANGQERSFRLIGAASGGSISFTGLMSAIS